MVIYERLDLCLLNTSWGISANYIILILYIGISPSLSSTLIWSHSMSFYFFKKGRQWRTYIQKHNVLWKHLIEKNNVLHRQKIIGSWKEYQKPATHCKDSNHKNGGEKKQFKILGTQINKLGWKQSLSYVFPLIPSNSTVWNDTFPKSGKWSWLLIF